MLLPGLSRMMMGGRYKEVDGTGEPTQESIGGDYCTGESKLLCNNPNLDFPDVTLDFPEGVERSDVSLINGAVVDVVADNGGDIFINARNINISGGSNLCAGIGGINDIVGQFMRGLTQQTINNDVGALAFGR